MKGYINLYESLTECDSLVSGFVYKTKKQAVEFNKRNPCALYIDTVKIEWDDSKLDRNKIDLRKYR